MIATTGAELIRGEYFERPVGDRMRAPRDLRASILNLAGREVMVLSYSTVAVIEALEGLSPAEREVVELLLSGASNAEIARQRGTSARTVANQAASIFRKLGVGSRMELAHRLLHPDADGRDGPPAP
ncbi:helix-turn-helix domain-containing protein [Polyangium aurulentum]|uniref:helix-turn-helix domain-containing protein n=1 Tax=Polyangium aurulentum TaxID=2567896 RepID=UPI00200EBA68|nr:helix-turn-helix transcriptional regulator [Polyangium aurulentum]UQA62031.1 helix-turn-helix transcriptional regulator [Polyangium aurulentum]